MITRYEQIMGWFTLTGVGAAIILSHFVMASTTYYIEINFGLSQYLYGAFFFICALIIGIGKLSRPAYFLCLSPFGLYTIANARYIYAAGLASVVPYICLALFIALSWYVIQDVVYYLRLQWRKHLTLPQTKQLR